MQSDAKAGLRPAFARNFAHLDSEWRDHLSDPSACRRPGLLAPVDAADSQ